MGPVMVISDGGIAGLLACAAAGSGGGGSIWAPSLNADTYLTRRRAAERAAGLYGLSVLGGPDIAGGADPEGRTRMLLEACFLAKRSGIGTVLWPVTAGPELELDRVAAAADRALLAGRLASVGQDPGVEIRVPYVDYTDRQLADLVLDMDLPIWTCWWYDAAGNASAEAERAHWAALLREAGWTGDLPGPHLAVSTPVTQPRAARAGNSAAQ